MSTIGFSGMPDLVVGLEITLDIAVLVKSSMADLMIGDAWYFSHKSGLQVCDYLSTMRFSDMPGQVV